MPKISIIFDRLRSEEKMLQKAAAELGHDITLINAKTAQMSTDPTQTAPDMGDVVLQRCISHYRGVYVAAFLEFLGVPTINNWKVSYICGNKILTTLRLEEAGIPTPKTYFAFSKEMASECVERVGYPLVIKPVIGSWGRGVMPIKDRDAMDAIIEIRELSDTPHDRIYYLQEMVDRPPRDIRVITIGEQAVAAMYRQSGGRFRTNVASGGDPEICEITGELEDMAIAASRAAGGGILGVDIMEDKKRGMVVHEVNGTVEFRGLSSVSRRDIPRAMIEFAVDHIHR